MISNKPEITNIIPNDQKAGQRDVYVDGAFYLTVPAELLYAEGLCIGAPFGAEEEESLLFAARLVPAKEKAYQYLGYGDLSRKKLMEKLCRFGIEEEVAAAACDYMEERGFIDDARLAGRLCARFAESKHWGRRRILPELQQRGIPAELAREALDALDFDYTDGVRHHLETKYRKSDLGDPRERNRAVQGLLRLGFEYEEIRSVMADQSEDYDD